MEEWFIFLIKKGKSKYYKASNPEKIADMYKKINKESENDIKNLKQKYENLEKKTNIVFRQWKKAIQNIYNDLLNSLPKWWIFYRITSELEPDKIKSDFQPKNYLEKRDKKQIERYVIMSEKAKKFKKAKLEREEKIIKNEYDNFDDNISFTIYADKISFIDFNTQTSILIESKELAEFQKKVFKLLFKKL